MREFFLVADPREKKRKCSANESVGWAFVEPMKSLVL